VGFETPAADTRKVVYEVGGRRGSIEYTVAQDGSARFTFTDPSGRTSTETYTPRTRGPGGGGRPGGGGPRRPGGGGGPPRPGERPPRGPAPREATRSQFEPGNATREALLEAIKGTALAEGTLTTTYERKPQP
jgi:hypothetical protein